MGKYIPLYLATPTLGLDYDQDSPLYSPAWVKGEASPNTTWFPTLKTERRCLQLLVGAGCCSHKLRQLVMDTCRVQTGWTWEPTASCHITASGHSSVWHALLSPSYFFPPQAPESSPPPFFPLPLFVASNQDFVPSLTYMLMLNLLNFNLFITEKANQKFPIHPTLPMPCGSSHVHVIFSDWTEKFKWKESGYNQLLWQQHDIKWHSNA